MKVLAAEDNPVFQTMLRSSLRKWGYDALIARDGNEAWAALQGPDAPRLAILDWMMPGIDGVEICRRIRAAAREPYQYVLLLTARVEAADLIEGMEAGADDYLTKPFHPQELRVRLRAGRRILELQEELVRAREALLVQATHDGLTGLLNRPAILDALLTETERTRRERQPLALVITDLDHFKAVNDRYGHLAGDAVLREAARRMKSITRGYDAVGRYGGEEFLMVLPGCGPAAAAARAEQLRQVIADTPFLVGRDLLPVTCCVGLCCREGATAADAYAMIQEADVALYKAKRRGRNRVEVSGGAPDEPSAYFAELCGMA